jgi:pimeloyl-ACP methyl ester carboxylesterase
MATRELLHDGPVQVDVLVDGVDGEGPTLVLLPSSLRDSLDFDDVAGRLAAAGLRVLRPQPRGMGASRGPMEDLTLHALASDVALAIERLGGGTAIVAGHAFGHYVARVAALDHPRRVRGVIVLAGAARTLPPELLESVTIAADPAQPLALRLAHLRRAFFAPGHDPTPWLAGWHPALRAIYRQAGATPNKDRWWPVSPVPMLDLQAEHDPWRPPETRDELQKVLGADRVSVAVIGNASHALLPEQPAAVAEAIVQWVRRTFAHGHPPM